MVRWHWWLVACVLWTGCDGGESSPDDPAADSNEDANGDPNDPTERPEGGGEFSSCEDLDEACQSGEVCDAWTCGGPPALYNHGGCPRTPCDSDAACPSGEACYARVYGGACLSSNVECGASESTCACIPSDDCDGIFDAHCLPIEVYSPQAYCSPSAFTCTELPNWLDALQRVADVHMNQGSVEIGESLQSCAQQAVDALMDC